jgi:hypothetical protein
MLLLLRELQSNTILILLLKFISALTIENPFRWQALYHLSHSTSPGVHVCVCMCVCVRVCVCVCVCVCVVCMYVIYGVCVCVCVCMYVIYGVCVCVCVLEAWRQSEQQREEARVIERWLGPCRQP